MSAGCKRLFGSTKTLISPERERLAVDIIEASECSKNRWCHGLLHPLADDYKIEDGSEVVGVYKDRFCILQSFFPLCYALKAISLICTECDESKRWALWWDENKLVTAFPAPSLLA